MEEAAEVDAVLEASLAVPVDSVVDSEGTAVVDFPVAEVVVVASAVEIESVTGTMVEATVGEVEVAPGAHTAVEATEEGTATTVPAPVARQTAADLHRGLAFY